MNLGPNVNTRYVDTHPVISPDGRTLYFAREEQPRQRGRQPRPAGRVVLDACISGKNKTWSPAKNLGGPINTPDDPNGLASVSANGQSAILINIYNRDGTIDPQGCSLSKRTRMGWTQPVKQDIKDFVNLDKEHVDFFLATSGKALLMAVERPEGMGGQDMFVSFPVPETPNTWTKPKNLGRT